MRFGQSRLDISDEMDVEKDKARNDADVAKDNRLSRDQGIDAVLKAHKLDAILTPGGTGANLTSRAGYPIIVVPFGMVPNAPTPPLPAGFNARPAPFGWRHRHGLHRAAADRAGLRLRAGQQEAGAATRPALTGTQVAVMRVLTVVALVGLLAGLSAQAPATPPQLPADAAESTLRALVAAAPRVAQEPAPLLVKAPSAGFELGMVSWVAAGPDGTVYLLQRGDKADPILRSVPMGRSGGRGARGST